MAYNKAREEQKWKKWKEREEEKLRELGMDEVSIQALHESDWADFNSERRYRERSEEHSLNSSHKTETRMPSSA